MSLCQLRPQGRVTTPEEAEKRRRGIGRAIYCQEPRILPDVASQAPRRAPGQDSSQARGRVSAEQGSRSGVPGRPQDGNAILLDATEALAFRGKRMTALLALPPGALVPPVQNPFETGPVTEPFGQSSHTTGKIRGILCGRCNLAMGTVRRQSTKASRGRLHGSRTAEWKRWMSRKLTGAEKEQQQRRRQAEARARRISATSDAADIGDCPPCANPDRRTACRNDLHAFLTTYFSHGTEAREFSADHRHVMRRIESIVLSGGRLPLSVFRGWAKTWILERAALWAALYGHRVYVVLYGATGPLAKEILGSIKTSFTITTCFCKTSRNRATRSGTGAKGPTSEPNTVRSLDGLPLAWR